MGVKALRKIQLGDEAVAGTAVAASAIWRGEGVLEDTREVVHVPEDVGYLSGYNRTYIPMYGGRISFSDTPATFEQLPYILSAGVQSVIAGTADGVGSGYIYEYSFSTTSANAVKTYTIEAGDDQQAEEMEYSFVEAFSLSGNGGEAVMMSADWVGRQVTNTTYTGALSLASVEEILFNKGVLSIDAATDTIGSTAISGSLLGFQLDVVTGWKVKHTADGNLYFNFNWQDRPEVMLQLTFEHDSNAVTEKTAWRNETAQQIRLDFTGSTFAATGDVYDNKTLRIDLAGKWQDFDVLGDQDGNDILTGTFKAEYDSDASLFAKITVVNLLASLP